MPDFPCATQVVQVLTQTLPATHILILTGYEDTELATELIAAGAHGYLLKDALTDTLVTALRHVAAGGLWLAPQVSHALRRRAEGATSAPSLPQLSSSPPVNLTRREAEILRLIREGYQTERTAEQLHISVETVRTHLKNIYAKLGVSNRTEAVLYALNHDLG